MIELIVLQKERKHKSYNLQYDDYQKECIIKKSHQDRKIKLKNKIRKNYELDKRMYTTEEIEKLYNSLELPQIKNINKADFLEYYLYFNENIDFYKLYCEIKDKNTSWKDFRYTLNKNLKYMDINPSDRNNE